VQKNETHPSFMGVVHIFADEVERYKVGKDPTPLRRWASLWSSIVVGILPGGQVSRCIGGPGIAPVMQKGEHTKMGEVGYSCLSRK
jgi:hypothetical protein